MLYRHFFWHHIYIAYKRANIIWFLARGKTADRFWKLFDNKRPEKIRTDFYLAIHLHFISFGHHHCHPQLPSHAPLPQILVAGCRRSQRSMFASILFFSIFCTVQVYAFSFLLISPKCHLNLCIYHLGIVFLATKWDFSFFLNFIYTRLHRGKWNTKEIRKKKNGTKNGEFM